MSQKRTFTIDDTISVLHKTYYPDTLGAYTASAVPRWVGLPAGGGAKQGMGKGRG